MIINLYFQRFSYDEYKEFIAKEREDQEEFIRELGREVLNLSV